MAVELVQSATNAQQNKVSGATNLVLTMDASLGVTAGQLLVVGIGCDNLSATTPTITSIAKPGGETNSWTQLSAGNAHTATAAGGVRSFVWSILATTAWTASSTYTITFSGAITAKAYGYLVFTGVTNTARSTAASATAASGGSLSCTTTGTVPKMGDLALGCGVVENNVSYNGDANWLSFTNVGGSFTSGSGAASNAAVCFQHMWTSNGTHPTYNPGSIADGSACVAVLQQAYNTPPDYDSKARPRAATR